jgi:hypothetical protein
VGVTRGSLNCARIVLLLHTPAPAFSVAPLASASDAGLYSPSPGEQISTESSGAAAQSRPSPSSLLPSPHIQLSSPLLSASASPLTSLPSEAGQEPSVALKQLAQRRLTAFLKQVLHALRCQRWLSVLVRCLLRLFCRFSVLLCLLNCVCVQFVC